MPIPLVVAGAAIAAEELAALVVASGLAAQVSTPEGRKHLGRAVAETGKAIDEAISGITMAASQACTSAAKSVAQSAEKAKTRDDDPCKPFKDVEERERNVAIEKSSKVNDYNRQIKNCGHDDVHPDFVPTHHDPDHHYNRALWDEARMRTKEKLEQLQSESRAAGKRLDEAILNRKKCEADQKRRQEAEQARRQAEARKKAEDKVKQYTDDANIREQIPGKPGQYRYPNPLGKGEMVTREQLIEAFLKSGK